MSLRTTEKYLQKAKANPVALLHSATGFYFMLKSKRLMEEL
jgi:hypothetical protein